MKRRDVIRRIGREAKLYRRRWTLVRQGSKHDVWSLDGKEVTIPRHGEINEFTAEGIFRRFEIEFGKGWWRE